MKVQMSQQNLRRAPTPQLNQDSSKRSSLAQRVEETPQEYQGYLPASNLYRQQPMAPGHTYSLRDPRSANQSPGLLSGHTL